ncbi:sialin-like [Physella acuta]|uniref:sialin-like n=1 Tax=Physella acuta TaxID=109671 RepID=UPI0027DC2E81|nr:sialin-like [Physella acuta]
MAMTEPKSGSGSCCSMPGSGSCCSMPGSGSCCSMSGSCCSSRYTSCRWTLAYMLFLLRMCQTALRQSIGMTLVCMLQRSDIGVSRHLPGNVSSLCLGNATTQSVTAGCQNLTNSTTHESSSEGEFSWDVTFEGVVLSSYYYGYLVTPLLSMYVERVVGVKRLIAACIGAGAVINLMTPELTRLHRYLLVLLRVLAGTTNGLIDPAVQSLWAAWAPRSEIASLTAVEYAGVSMGGILTFLISGILCQISVDRGWPLVFYFYGTTSALWVVLWLTIIADHPQAHPKISPEELKFITAGTQDSTHLKKSKTRPPWRQILSSTPVWAVVIATSSFTWVYSWVLCYLPMYMQDGLQYQISQNALLSSLPFVGKFLSGLACGYLADRLLRTRLALSTNRKLFQIIGSVGCAACCLAVGFLDNTSRTTAVILLVLAVTSQNMTTVAFRINALDIAPRYASLIIGLSNTVAVAASMTAPLVTSAVIYQKTQAQWQTMFYIVAAQSIVGGLAFVVMGKTSTQKWAQAPTDKDQSVSVPMTHQTLVDVAENSGKEEWRTEHESSPWNSRLSLNG